MSIRIIHGDARDLSALKNGSIHCVATSPPYLGLRSYLAKDDPRKALEIGAERTPEKYIGALVDVFRGVRRVLRDDGSMWLNLGDVFSGAHVSREHERGSDGTTGSSCLGRECASGNPCDEHKDVWLSRTQCTYGCPGLAQWCGLLLQIQACMAELLDHPPTAGSARQTQTRRCVAATLDLVQIAAREGELLLSSAASKLRGSSQPRQAVPMLAGAASACLSSLHSFSSCALRCVHTWNGNVDAPDGTSDSVLLCEELRHCSQCTFECCSLFLSCVEPQNLHGNYAMGNSRVKSKNLLLMPYRVALALQDDGWILRAAIPWVKASCMPESVTDRPTTAHETVFLFAKTERYFADPDAVRVAGGAGAKGSTFTRGKTGINGLGRVGDGARDDNSAGRNIRTSDFFDAGLDAYQRALAEQAAHVAHVRANGGMLLSQDGDPLALLVNPVPSTYKHFAMWPPDLVKPMIMFSTPEAGVCAACGAPRKRIVERSRYPRGKTSHRGESAWAAGAATRNDVDLTRSGQEFNRWKRDNPDRLMGWEATCSCLAAAIPATVLDPFGGTGTTARVAEDLGRDSVIMELDGKSVQIAEERTAQAGLLGRAVGL